MVVHVIRRRRRLAPRKIRLGPIVFGVAALPTLLLVAPLFAVAWGLAWLHGPAAQPEAAQTQPVARRAA